MSTKDTMKATDHNTATSTIRFPKFRNFGDYFFWAYANFQMFVFALNEGKSVYDRQCFMLRAKAYKSYREGRWKPHDLYMVNKWKMSSADSCWYCGCEFSDINVMTLDHVFPRAAGGDSAMDNLVPVCKSCNSSKGKKDLLQWFYEQGYIPAPRVIAQYYRQIYLYAVEHGLLDKHREELQSMSLPFNVDYFIFEFPQPESWLN